MSKYQFGCVLHNYLFSTYNKKNFKNCVSVVASEHLLVLQLSVFSPLSITEEALLQNKEIMKPNCKLIFGLDAVGEEEYLLTYHLPPS